MKSRLIIAFALIAVSAVACSGDEAELSTDSTIVTGGTNAPSTTATTQGAEGEGEEATATTLVGEPVSGYTVVNTIPNDNGVERWYVIPEGAYTDVDLENFVIDLIEADSTLYGAEIFDSEAAAEAYALEPAERTEDQVTVIENDHLVTLVGRDSIEFHGPFAEFTGGAIGS